MKIRKFAAVLLSVLMIVTSVSVPISAEAAEVKDSEIAVENTNTDSNLEKAIKDIDKLAAEPSKTSGDYAINEMTATCGIGTATANVVSESNSILVIAVYDENGEMIGSGYADVEGKTEEQIVSVEIPDEVFSTAKAFLLNAETYEPLCNSFTEEKKKGDTEKAEKLKTEISSYSDFDKEQAVAESVRDIGLKWVDENGYIPLEDVVESTEEIYIWTQELASVGIISGSSMNDESYCVSMLLNDGTTMIYAPSLEGYNSGSGNELSLMSTSVFSDKDEKNIKNTAGKKGNECGEYLCNNVDEITNLDTISGLTTVTNVKNFISKVNKNTRVLFWESHGTLVDAYDHVSFKYDQVSYKKGVHFAFSIGEGITEEKSKNYKKYIDEKSVIKGIWLDDNTSTMYFITESFFENYMGQAENALFVGHSCYSDNSFLKKVLESKGFETMTLCYLAVNSNYGRNMMNSIAEYLSEKDMYGRYKTAEYAYNNAEEDNNYIIGPINKNNILDSDYFGHFQMNYYDKTKENNHPPFRVVPDNPVVAKFELQDEKGISMVNIKNAKIKLTGENEKEVDVEYHLYPAGFWTRLEPGDYTVKATLEDNGHYAYVGKFTIAETDDVKKITCKMTKSNIVKISVVNADSEVIKNADVKLTNGKDSYNLILSDTDYIVNVPNGTYDITIFANGYEPIKDSIKVTEDDTVFYTLYESGVLHGDVINKKTGQRLSDVKVQCVSEDYSETVYTDLDGVFEIPLPSGTYDVTLSKNFYQDLKIKAHIDVGVTTFFLDSLELEPLPTGIKGKVIDKNTGKIIKGATVDVLNSSNEIVKTTKTSNTGEFNVDLSDVRGDVNFKVEISATGYKKVTKNAMVLTYTVTDLGNVELQSESDNKCGDNVYWNLEDGTLTIYGEGDMYNYGQIHNIKFSDLEEIPWYNERDSIYSIVIENGVTSIGVKAFYECIGLTSVEIPNSVTSIRAYAFEDCRSLTSIEIPDSVTSIEMYAFNDCRSLTSIEIPNSVTDIGVGAFYECTGLTNIEIPNSVTEINMSVFWNCSSLTSIEIPNSVTSIQDWAFVKCSSLKDVYYSGTKEQWEKISIRSYNSSLTSATIHYNSRMPNSSGSSLPTPSAATITNYLAPTSANTKTTVVSKSTNKEYTGLVQNGRYIFMLVKSDKAENLVASDNLVYINQYTADENGKVTAYYPDTYGNKYTALIFGGKTTTKDTDIDSDTDTDTDTKPEKTTTKKGKIYFDASDWGSSKILFYIWDETNGKYATSNGWIDESKWGSVKNLSGKAVAGKDYIFESYEIEIDDSHDVFVIFYDPDTDLQTTDYPLYSYNFGMTAYLTGSFSVNAADSSKETSNIDFRKNMDSGYKTVTYPLGDIDGDGKLTSADSLYILRYSVKLETFDDIQTQLADVDNDGSINSADSLAVLRASVGLYDNPNVGKPKTIKIKAA